jgi:hypothetical protein
MEILTGIGIGVLVGALLAGFGAFYRLHGRLSRLEGMFESMMGELGVTKDYPIVKGLPLPMPAVGKPVGGSIAVAETLELPASQIREEQLAIVFEAIADTRALTNLVRRGEVAVKDLRLESVADGNPSSSGYQAVLTLENRTAAALEFTVPKGQVFENRELGSGRQNLAAAREQTTRLEPQGECEFRVDALCMNRNLSGPNGSLGNLTVLKLRDDSFSDQTELWRSVDDSVRRAKIITEGRRRGVRKSTAAGSGAGMKHDLPAALRNKPYPGMPDVMIGEVADILDGFRAFKAKPIGEKRAWIVKARAQGLDESLCQFPERFAAKEEVV